MSATFRTVIASKGCVYFNLSEMRELFVEIFKRIGALLLVILILSSFIWLS